MTTAHIGQQRPRIIALRVNDAEKAETESLAQAMGMSVSALIRESLARMQRELVESGSTA